MRLSVTGTHRDGDTEFFRSCGAVSGMDSVLITHRAFESSSTRAHLASCGHRDLGASATEKITGCLQGGPVSGSSKNFVLAEVLKVPDYTYLDLLDLKSPDIMFWTRLSTFPKIVDTSTDRTTGNYINIDTTSTKPR